MAVDIQPMAVPSLVSGTWDATITVAAELYPASAPIPARSASISHGVRANPISVVKTAIPSVDRSTISLRP